MNERRLHPRMTINNLTVDVSDGVGVFKGRISDISQFGISMADLPKKFSIRTKKLTAVISNKHQHFKMNISPKWYTDGGGMKIVGSELLNPPWEWTDFVARFEPSIMEDVWGEIRL